MDTANVIFVHFHFPRDAFPRAKGRGAGGGLLNPNKVQCLKYYF